MHTHTLYHYKDRTMHYYEQWLMSICVTITHSHIALATRHELHPIGSQDFCKVCVCVSMYCMHACLNLHLWHGVQV